MNFKNFIFMLSFGSLLIISCSELKDDITTTSPKLSVHKDGFAVQTSPNFHGKVFTGSNALGFKDCVQCHAGDFNGGIAKVACTNCHTSIAVHQEGILDQYSSNFHGKFIASNLVWNIQECGTCHSSDYSGSIASPSCLNCHTGEGGPEDCNTCHGDFNDPTKIAPPEALNGSSDSTYAGVGAHTSHLYKNNLGSEISCSTCHKVPQSLFENGHIGEDGKAELNFGGLSIFGGVNPSYNFTDNTCSDTYCHGNFTFYKDSSSYAFVYTTETITGNNLSVKWNKVDGTQSECGSCHGLPPEGHKLFPIECAYCHTGVVNVQGEIIDPTKHINGVINVYGN